MPHVSLPGLGSYAENAAHWRDQGPRSRSRSLKTINLRQTLGHSARSKPCAYSNAAEVRDRRALPTNFAPDPRSSPSKRSPLLLWAIASAEVMPEGSRKVNIPRFRTKGYPPGSPATPGVLARSVSPVSKDIITEIAVAEVTVFNFSPIDPRRGQKRRLSISLFFTQTRG
jgi:hypothetical protein